MAKSLPFSLVSRCLGVLLLAAACLKLNGLAVDPVGRMGAFSDPAFQVGVIEFEIFLAAWLLWGRQALGAWATALAAFAAFAGVSAHQGWIGRASCGCFGRLSVSPWYAVGLDVVVLLALLLGRPDLTPEWKSPKRMLASVLPVAYGLGGAAVALALLGGLASLLYGSPEAALARLRGERVSLYPRLIDVGTGAPGQTYEAPVEVVNRTDHIICLVGGTLD